RVRAGKGNRTAARLVLTFAPIHATERGVKQQPTADSIKMEATAVEQQREARRQKVLARSQGGHRAPVVDLATEQKEIAPRGVTADLDDDDVGAVVDDHPPLPAPEDAGKSASRLAAERRRQ
ncbi:unnamed protein product, partial [Ectocarpus sp. 12 AP-2014]